jgi:hypothetical protein
MHTLYGGPAADKAEDEAIGVVQAHVGDGDGLEARYTRLLAVYVMARALMLKHGIEPESIAAVDRRASYVAERLEKVPTGPTN